MPTEVFGIFPTPVMRVPGALGPDLVKGLVAFFSGQGHQTNNTSGNLTHTAMLRPSDSPLLVEAAVQVTPRVSEFGALLFGEHMGWSLKEMWVNFMDRGGFQAMHNHANSFISGVIYLTPMHKDSRTVFMKSPGARNSRSRTTTRGSPSAPTTPRNGSAPSRNRAT